MTCAPSHQDSRRLTQPVLAFVLLGVGNATTDLRQDKATLQRSTEAEHGIRGPHKFFGRYRGQKSPQTPAHFWDISKIFAWHREHSCISLLCLPPSLDFLVLWQGPCRKGVCESVRKIVPQRVCFLSVTISLLSWLTFRSVALTCPVEP